MVFLVPDWPVHAHLRERAATEESPADAAVNGGSPAQLPPIALVAQHRVVACSPEARSCGVRPGQRERDAYNRCPDLTVHPHDPEVDERRFASVIAALEQLVPGIAPIRPGICALHARGPARFYGGEGEAGARLIALATELGFPGARIGIADGSFTAEQAARAGSTDPGVEAPHPGVRIVASESTARFLARLPVERATGDGFATVLHGLGVHSLGSFAALPEEAVRQRFGAAGVAAHLRASGRGRADDADISPRAPERDRTAEMSFDPPVDTADRLAFACSSLAETFVSGLSGEGLVCTALRVELIDDTGRHHERIWAHPHRFTAFDVVNRIRWQAGAVPPDPERGGSGIVLVRVVPTRTDRTAAHEPGLWNTEPDERVHHHLSRAQAALGHTAVGTARIGGGRLLSDRQTFIPWSTTGRAAASNRSGVRPHGPWPGSLPAPHPTTVFRVPRPAALVDEHGDPVLVDEDELLTRAPAALQVDGAATTALVEHWSAPWSLSERWWNDVAERHRIQVLLDDGAAWLLIFQAGRWFAEGVYE